MKTHLTKSAEVAAQYLKDGNVVAFPTETVYGLGADINNEKALSEIFKLKGRPADNPLIVHISKVSQLAHLAAIVPEEAHKLIELFWPGPLTLIFKAQDNISNLVTAGLETVAVRLPNHQLALKLLDCFGAPLAAPSANISGKPSSTKYQNVLADFDQKIPCLLVGETQIGLESTVLDCSVWPFVLLRNGSVSLEDLQKVVPEIVLVSSLQEDAPVRSPGLKYKHYAPEAKVRLLIGPESNTEVEDEDAAYIGIGEPMGAQFKKQLICSSLEHYAKELFAFFRECDQEQIKIIYCKWPPETGIGRALRDRLKRASENQGL
jgi:L-threonylcarbamoyladenylate synthase